MKYILLIILSIFLIGCTTDDVVNNSELNDSNLNDSEFIKNPVTFDIGGEEFSSAKNIKLNSGAVNLDDWVEIYDGYGDIRFSKNNVGLVPKSPEAVKETHAALVLYRDVLPRDFIIDMRMVLNKQLRDSPNPWESGWFLFNYVDENNFYYIAFKTNGIELGRVIDGKQEFLLTKDNPKIIPKEIYKFKIIFDNENLELFIGSSRAINFNVPRVSGKIALYSEDADVEFLNIRAINPD